MVEAARMSRQSAHQGGKVVSRTHRPPLPPIRYPRYSFLLEGWVDPRAIMRPKGLSLKNSSETIGNRTFDLRPCGAVPSQLRHRSLNTISVFSLWQLQSFPNSLALLLVRLFFSPFCSTNFFFN